MRRIKQLSFSLTASLIAAVFLLAPAANAVVTLKPPLRVYGGDVFIGGGFNNWVFDAADQSQGHQTQCQQGDFDWPANQPQSYAGIYTYNSSINGVPTGSTGDFGVFAMGLIEGNNAGSGFASAANISGNTNPSLLSFANKLPNGGFNNNYWGGLFGGSGNCIPNYYYGKWNNANNDHIWSGEWTHTNGQYKLDIGTGLYDLTPGQGNDIQIQRGQSLTLFIKGNVYIKNNIKYSQADTTSSVPKFTLIVLGNIYLDKTVKRLDGLYIAQPDMTSQTTANQTGQFWTCHPDSRQSYTAELVYQKCDSDLVINGAVIAKQAYFLRTGEGNNDLDSVQPAEVINYTPEMVIGGPLFNAPGVNGDYQIEGLTSLPPVF